MRILQLGPYPPPHGGVQTHLKAIHDRLQTGGHLAMVAAITRNSVTDGVPNVFKPRSAFSLIRLLLNLRYDLVHLHIGGELTTRLALLTLICGLLPKRKSVVTFHSGGYAAHKGESASRFSLRGIAFRSVDHVIAVNMQVLEMLGRFGVNSSDRSLIVPFAGQRPTANVKVRAEVDEFIARHKPLLLTVGLLENEYALDIQVEAFESVLAKYPDAGLLIFGSGSLSSKLEKLIDCTPYKDKILLAGDVNHDSTLRSIELADVLLRPTYYDGDAISVREALFLGTPVIATDDGMRPAGVILIPLPPNPTQLAEKIIETLGRDRQIVADSQADGWENIDSVIAVYDRLLTA